METIINIRELLDSAPNFGEAGYAAFYDINAALEENRDVTIDMENVSLLPTAFMNTAVAPAVERFGKDVFKDHVKLKNVTKASAAQWSVYIDNF